jgi:hypothetical protein
LQGISVPSLFQSDYLNDLSKTVRVVRPGLKEKGIAMTHCLFMTPTFLECTPTPSAMYEHPVTETDTLIFSKFLCGRTSTISVSVNFTNLTTDRVQVIIGHSNDTIVSIRRTELPVILMPGMDLLGFAHHRKVRKFRYPRLSSFGLFAVCTRNSSCLCRFSLLKLIQNFDDFIMTEITHLQPNTVPRLTSNDSASLVVIPRDDHSDIRIIQDYRERTVLKGFSDIGGLWTIIAFIFGALFGSSLLRVAFGTIIKYIKTILTILLLAGVKPISIVGLAHKAVEQETLQKYRDTYPFLDSDIEKLRARAGLLTLLVNHLIDLELFTKADAQACLPDVVMNEEVEMSTTHDADELAVD